MVLDYSPHSGYSLKYQTFQLQKRLLRPQNKVLQWCMWQETVVINWNGELLTVQKGKKVTARITKYWNRYSHEAVASQDSSRQNPKRAGLNSTLTPCSAQSWTRWSPEILYNWNYFDLPGHPKVHVFFCLYPLNEIKIRIKHHSKNLFYESSRIWFKHKIKMHSILVFICQEVINMQSRIYKRLSKTSFFLSKQLKKMIFVINQQIFLQILLTVPC